ncbi:hypothetical protein THAOC_16759, partial [Thalassiosira oceanica]
DVRPGHAPGQPRPDAASEDPEPAHEHAHQVPGHRRQLGEGPAPRRGAPRAVRQVPRREDRPGELVRGRPVRRAPGGGGAAASSPFSGFVLPPGASRGERVRAQPVRRAPRRVPLRGPADAQAAGGARAGPHGGDAQERPGGRGEGTRRQGTPGDEGGGGGGGGGGGAGVEAPERRGRRGRPHDVPAGRRDGEGVVHGGLGQVLPGRGGGLPPPLAPAGRIRDPPEVGRAGHPGVVHRRPQEGHPLPPHGGVEEAPARRHAAPGGHQRPPPGGPVHGQVAVPQVRHAGGARGRLHVGEGELRRGTHGERREGREGGVLPRGRRDGPGRRGHRGDRRVRQDEARGQGGDTRGDGAADHIW